MDVAIIDWKSCEELSHKTDWEEEDEHALIDHIFDRKERLAKKGMQTKLFTAEEKKKVCKQRICGRGEEEGTWHKKSKQVCCWADQVKEKIA